MRVTISDIAAKAGVSKSLVSMHLNRRPGARLAPATMERIDRAVKELNYRPSAMARALREGCSRTVGLVIGNITGFYTGFYIQSLLTELNARGYQLLPAIVPHYDRSEELRCLQNLIDRRVDGVIYALRLNPTPEMAELLRGYPILQCRPAHAGYSSSSPDYSGLMTALCRRENGKRFLACDTYRSETATAACNAEGTRITYLDSTAANLERFFEAAQSGDYDTVLFNDTLKIKRLLARNPGAALPRIVSAYGLPVDFINHPAIAGAFVYPFREVVRLRVERMIGLIERPGGEPLHMTEPVRFLGADELLGYFEEQAADSYFGDSWRYGNAVL